MTCATPATHPGGERLLRHIDAALAAPYPGSVDAHRPMLAGFSLGATEVALLAQKNAARFPRIAILEGGVDVWYGPTIEAVAGGARVLFGCGSAWCTPSAMSAAARIGARAGLESRVDIAGVGPTMAPPLRRRSALSLPGFSPATTAGTGPTRFESIPGAKSGTGAPIEWTGAGESQTGVRVESMGAGKSETDARVESMGAGKSGTGARVASMGAGKSGTASRVASMGAGKSGTGSRVASIGAGKNGTGSRVASMDAGKCGTDARLASMGAGKNGTGARLGSIGAGKNGTGARVASMGAGMNETGACLESMGAGKSATAVAVDGTGAANRSRLTRGDLMRVGKNATRACPDPKPASKDAMSRTAAPPSPPECPRPGPFRRDGAGACVVIPGAARECALARGAYPIAPAGGLATARTYAKSTSLSKKDRSEMANRNSAREQRSLSAAFGQGVGARIIVAAEGVDRARRSRYARRQLGNEDLQPRAVGRHPGSRAAVSSEAHRFRRADRRRVR